MGTASTVDAKALSVTRRRTLFVRFDLAHAVSMSRNDLAFATLTVSLIALGTTGCGSSKKQQPTQIPNPASVYCVKSGGKVDSVTTENGTASYCILPDGTRIDEWEYFRQHNP
jgi:uncharacterized protein